MRVVFLGPPAAGKGTQAKLVGEKIDLPLIVMGDILRHAMRQQSEVGQQAQKYIDAGELVPDDLIIRIITDRLQQQDCQTGFLLDGFPRTLNQARALDQVMSATNHQLDHVIYFTIDEATAVERISGRRSCEKCGAVYHLGNNPPKITGQCDACGGNLFHRPDDTPEVFQKRFENYREQTAPLLDYYRQQHLLRRIDATRPIDETLQQTLHCLGFQAQAQEIIRW